MCCINSCLDDKLEVDSIVHSEQRTVIVPQTRNVVQTSTVNTNVHAGEPVDWQYVYHVTGD